jgi:hypothetical protein
MGFTTLEKNVHGGAGSYGPPARAEISLPGKRTVKFVIVCRLIGEAVSAK